ncbi:hypothetical protein ABIB58_002853 [Brevundimonas sp. UYEF29]|uniref:hypothetical protein n=1 Tax=Brevundimonas sp. UYEF29 TaxID=3156346 RepID=UPI0033968BB8
MTDEKKPVDWVEIERDYRSGTMSIRELAAWYGISDTAIRKRAKRDGWERPAGATGSRREPAPEPEQPKVYVGTVLTPENTTPEAIVGRGRNLVMRMMDELDATTTRNGELEALIVSSTDEADASGQRSALMQAVSLKTRSDVLKALATAAKTLAESSAPQGVKKQRQEAGERVAKGGGKFSAPPPPLRLVQ